MIMMDAEADESTLSACALPTCHCQAVLANERLAFGVQRSGWGIISRVHHQEPDYDDRIKERHRHGL